MEVNGGALPVVSHRPQMDMFRLDSVRQRSIALESVRARVRARVTERVRER
jgi:hypothetical protein